MQVGIIAALPSEAHALARLRAEGRARLPGGARLALSGIGRQRAEASARAMVAEGVDALVSWGSAAALCPTLAPGDLLLPAMVIAADGRRYITDESWRERLAARVAERVPIRRQALAESSMLLTDVAAKQRLRAATAAAASDMESAAIAGVAAAHGLPFLAVRVVADDATMILPPAARAAVDDAGALRPLSMLKALAGPPRSMHAQLRALKHLSVAFRATRTTLARISPAVLEETAE